MHIETLVSTMNKKNKEDIIKMLEKMNIQTDAIVINQNSNKENIIKTEMSDRKIKIINKKNKGLSKSRNELLEVCDGDIGIIADDDLRYLNQYESIIKEAYNRNKDADVICFKVYKGEKPLKRYSEKKNKVGFFRSLQKSSVEITYKIESIKKNSIKFDENFGSGSEKYISGEENIFLADCLRKKLKIIYEPVFIARLNDKKDSSWFKGYNEQYFKTKGAAFYRINPKISLMLIIIFATRKKYMYKKEISFFKAIKFMYNGRKECKERKVE